MCVFGGEGAQLETLGCVLLYGKTGHSRGRSLKRYFEAAAPNSLPLMGKYPAMWDLTTIPRMWQY